MPPRNPNKRYSYPYMLRGRVEVAVFNCPHCNNMLKFRGTTVYKKRCPRCQTTLYVFLRVCVSRSGLPRAPKHQKYGTELRPIDTILPVVLTTTGTQPPPPPPPDTDPSINPSISDSQPADSPLVRHNRRRSALNSILQPLEGEPRSLMAPGPRRLLADSGHQPAGEEVDQFVAELGELGIDHAIESLPNVGLGTWQAGEGELAHRLVDLDELRERGESLRAERIGDSEPEYPESSE